MSRVKKTRILHLAISLKEGDGGVASVSRSIVAAMGGWHETPCEVYAVTMAKGKLVFLLGFIFALLRFRPHLIVVDHIHLLPPVFLTAFWHRCPYVIFCHGIEMDQGVTPIRYHALEACTLRVTNSRFTAHRLTKKFGWSFVPCSLGLDPAIERMNFENIHGLEKSVLIVGRMHENERYKGHDELIEAFSLVREKVPEAKLVIAGQGNDMERLKQLVLAKKLENRVRFTGWVGTAELQSLYRQCALFAMPSRREGFGLTYIEAMRHGKPVIASTLDAGAEVVDNGVTGYVIAPDDIPQLATRMIELLSDPAKARGMGRAGKERYQKLFTHTAFTRRWRATISSLIEPAEKKKAA